MTAEKPLSVGETLEQLLRKEGLNQTEAALKIGITRQYLNSVINGKLPFTTELGWKLEPVLRKGLDFWDQVTRQYETYLSTSEGRRQHMRAQQDELSDQWDILGAHDLVNYELETAAEARVISFEVLRGDTFVRAFDKERLTPVSYFLSIGDAAEVFDTEGNSRVVTTHPHFELKPRETARMASRETVRLGSRFMGMIVGLADPLPEQFIQHGGNLLIKPWHESTVGFRLMNLGGKPVRLSRGQPCLEVQFRYLAAEPARPESEPGPASTFQS